uniref:LysM domain-containing protein n=1 Tax=Amblyomma maculatum TaxID=34609 RepID=G3ML53_AMBMU
MVSLPKRWSLTKSNSRVRGPRYHRGRLRTNSEGDEQQAFIFADGDDVASDELGSWDDATELRLRGTQNGSRDSGDRNKLAFRKAPPLAVFEHRILEGETLQGLALRYGCTVGALRHLNNLLSDQDFFALNVLKVPDRIHVATGQLVDTCVPLDDTLSVASDGTESPPDKAIRYWKNLDHKVQAALQQQGAGDGGMQMDELEDGAADKHVLHAQGDKSSGADCGIGWAGVIAIVVIVAVLVPLFYVLYILVYKQEFHDGAVQLKK